MAYERFCDIHVTSATSYHFTSEIVDYCKYQLETKNLNLDGTKRSLIVLGYMENLEPAAVALLGAFEKATIVFYGSTSEASTKIQNLVKKLKPEEKVVLDASLNKTVATMVRKGAPDRIEPAVTPMFKGLIISQAEGFFSITRNGAGNAGQTVVFSTTRKLDLLDDKISYLAVSVGMSEMAAAQEDPTARKLVSWLSGAASKLRFNCHGDGEGNLQMSENDERSGQGNRVLSADCIASWLHANGLHSGGKLKTINLNLCLAARFKLTPAVLKNGQYSPAEGSAVALVAQKLGSYNVHGIKVTGSNEVIDSRFTADTTRTAVKGVLADHSQPFRKVSIPRGFTFENGSLTMTVPDGWTITERTMEESKLCVLKPPTGWSVSVSSGDFAFAGDGKSFAIGNDGWIVNLQSKEALSAEGWQRLDNQRMRFVGTGGTLALEATADKKITILERLAKSKAKAVAIS